MTMPCHISDYAGVNPWEGDKPSSRTLDSLTISDLMGDDHYVWVGKNKEFGYILEIENEEGVEIFEKCIHPFAARSLADFCRRYLSFYERIETEE
jgi:hypothetical protein